jgi:hypothetical protein
MEAYIGTDNSFCIYKKRLRPTRRPRFIATRRKPGVALSSRSPAPLTAGPAGPLKVTSTLIPAGCHFHARFGGS